MGIKAVAVYSDADADLPFVSEADQAVLHRPGPARAELPGRGGDHRGGRSNGAAAVHPGYGFLAENADFARRVEAAGLTWVGPDPAAIEQMGDKIRGPEPDGEGRACRSRRAAASRSPTSAAAVAEARPDRLSRSWSRPRPAAAASA